MCAFPPLLHDIIDGEAEEVEATEEVGEFALQEVFLANSGNATAGTTDDDHADAALLLQDSLALENVERTQDGVDIYLELGSQLTYAGHTVAFGIAASQDVVAEPFGNLREEGFVGLLCHGAQWICARQKAR